MKEKIANKNSKNPNENEVFSTTEATQKKERKMKATTKIDAMNTTQKTSAEKYAGEICTLDGEPARIVGRLLPFATVRTIRDGGPSFDYAWETVARVMENGGKFHS